MSSKPQPEFVRGAIEDLVKKTANEITELAGRNHAALELIGIRSNYMGFLAVSLIHTMKSMTMTEEFKNNESAKRAMAVGLQEIGEELLKQVGG